MAIAHDQFPLEQLRQDHSRRTRHPCEAASSLPGVLVTGDAELLTRADPGTRARMLRQFQGTVGNASVQRMLWQVATATVPVQRCGPIPCDCPPEEKRAARTVMQRAMAERPQAVGTQGGGSGGGTQQATPASAARFNANACVTECEERFQECLHPPWWQFWNTPDPNQCLAERQACLRECQHSAAECGDYCDPGDGQQACEACCDFDCEGNPEGARMCKTKCRSPYR